MSSWYGIQSGFLDLFDKYQSGELSDEEYSQMGNTLALELKNKGTSTQGYILQEEAELEAIKEQIKRLKAYYEAREKRLENMKDRVKQCLENLELKKLETPIGVITITKNPPSVEIEDEKLIPGKFFKDEIVTKLDKKAIIEALKKGENVQGTKFVTDKTSIRFK